MKNCELLETCIFFNDKMDEMPAVANLMKNRYCRAEYDQCARMQVVKAVGREKVPQDMFPNQEEYAQEVISNG